MRMSARRDRAIRGAVLAIPLALALPGAQRAVAHLALARTSLVALTSAADGIVVARAEGATDETGRTAFAFVAPIAGAAPPASFVASGPAPLLRYRTGELAVVLLERPADAGASPGSNRARPEWRSPQAAGTGIELASAAEGESVRPVLERLWAATHGSHAASTVAEPATTAALVAGDKKGQGWTSSSSAGG